MKVKIWIEHGKWVRADVVTSSGLGRNLYHLSFRGSIGEQLTEAKNRVIFDNPNQEIEFVVDN